MALAAMLFAVSMTFIDQTIVSIAAPVLAVPPGDAGDGHPGALAAKARCRTPVAG
ncbi:hypothetical protein ACFWGI_03665 [Streptomyces niveus]|uniref:hypothetical protein n=1 Tax=Streptomyces niveus TaxID=193462 RepID=UPI00365447C7